MLTTCGEQRQRLHELIRIFTDFAGGGPEVSLVLLGWNMLGT